MVVMDDGVVRRPEQSPGARWLVDALAGAFAAEHAAQVRQVELIARLTAVYGTVPATGPALPGHDRLASAGGEGTPLVAEHLATELAPQLRTTITSASIMIADSLDLVHRHPAVWAATREGRARVWQAKQVAAATRAAGLSREAAAWVDRRLSPPWAACRGAGSSASSPG